METEFLTVGVDHVGLTVRNLNETRDFFVKCLGWKQVNEKPEYPAAFVSDGSVTLTLWEVKNHNSVVEFDRRSNVGLHHLALKVKRKEDMDELLKRISEWPGAKIEFGPELLGKGPKTHMMVYEPGGIRIEFDYLPS
jgi:catechol 2,3-dioxygenase-like lactoylglutathione lyase family enzyme